MADLAGSGLPVERRSRRRLPWGVVSLALAIGGAWFLGVIRGPNLEHGPRLQATARLQPLAIAEVSGAVQSQRDPNLLWLHNDSGDQPRLFAVDLEGRPVRPAASSGLPPEQDPGLPVRGAHLVDWEDIALHQGRLFVGEVGNNLSWRRDLGIYEVSEPDPGRDREAQVRVFYPLRYPDQDRFPPYDRWDFDCEAIFWWEGAIYLVTKSRPAFRLYVQGDRAALYRLDTWHTDQVNVLTEVDRIDGLEGWVTAADASPDGRYVALLMESPGQGIWLFERPQQGDRFFSQPSSVRRALFHGGGQLEALAFVQRPEQPLELLLLNEAREIFRVSLDDFQEVPRTGVESGGR